MVSCACFSPSIHQKSKKNQHLSTKVHSASPQAEDQERNANFVDNNHLDISMEQATSPSSIGDCTKSEHLNCEESKEFLQLTHMKKSQSLGSFLDNVQDFTVSNNSDDDEVGQRLSSKGSHGRSADGRSADKFIDPHDGITSTEFYSHENMTVPHNHHNEICSLKSSDNNEVHSPEDASKVYNFPQEYDEDREVDHLIEGHEKYWNENFNCDNRTNSDKCEMRDHSASEIDDENTKLGALSPKELNIRRIEEWISSIDIENCTVEEPGECSSSYSTPEAQAESNAPGIKLDVKGNHGMEVAYGYMSSLTATSSSAQLVNLGLVSVPFLSAFTCLRVLNLAGNFIVHIPSGSLPRGLHMLNLSKNYIVTIEGLRDLTRLRVLDLSCNRIVRIGHGLASCSSLKELYLSNNKISDIEGLHRLLKLQVLDLRGNKISTAKGLGQLAANYNSLQSINLEGNPAQRNVGDDQLKKYLLTLLPNLVYYNKHSIKASGAKEISEFTSRSRSVGKRNEHKIARRGSHGSGLHKLALNHAIGPKSRHTKSPLKADLKSESSIRRNRSENTLCP